MAASSYGLRFDTGRTCLDLLTTAGRGPGPGPADLLGSAAGLARWLVGAGLVPRGDPPLAVDDRWLERFTALRALLHRMVHAALDGRTDPADVERLNVLCLPPTPVPRLVLGPHGEPVRRLAAPAGCGGLLSAVARDAADLLTDPATVARLRQCEGEGCDLVYVDTSRGHRRRWCSGAACGNRERVARHRRRALGPA
ncbi:ABATE domain-containing protein [Streptacidiphilus sp. ASG 303]|uniref:CGNR zinc finger domain-containing protein n=1 Tax=Streptacidiphilus sp. ASG 303 TaxID=2896847 RepID=UPI001E517259|nr:ABATE domain-containing protein [Streptacidiphilus sp. ASG 303]MCD0485087.1 ABATE domain-containing protein [Streptacidiphilus sp. ASG 303]